jgi:thioredoxin reductase (NADPH)
LREAQLGHRQAVCPRPGAHLCPWRGLFQDGEHCVPTWFLLSGSAELFSRDGLDEETSLRELESGQFTGELNELADRPSLTGAKAGPTGVWRYR